MARRGKQILHSGDILFLVDVQKKNASAHRAWKRKSIMLITVLISISYICSAFFDANRLHQILLHRVTEWIPIGL
jgi:hypothetical protein